MTGGGSQSPPAKLEHWTTTSKHLQFEIASF
jgi:hypothetical protein